MEIFEINGLHTVEGQPKFFRRKLYPDTVTVPNSFTVGVEGTYYYYEQTPTQWVCARLDGEFQPLAYLSVLFNPSQSRLIPLQSQAENILKVREAEIKAKLIEEKNAHAYIGPLTSSHIAQILPALAQSGVELPDDETQHDKWQEGLALALSSSLQHFEKNIPDGMPENIKAMLTGMMKYLNPARLDAYNFYEPLNERPSIGDVYDYSQRYFLQMLTDPAQLKNFKPARISKVFYDTTVGTLKNQVTVSNAGLSDAQSQTLIYLLKDYIKYDEYFSDSHNPYFPGIPIHGLEYIIGLLNKDIIKSDVEQEILDDFYACARALSSAEDDETFADRYQLYNANVFKKLPSKVKYLIDNKAAVLSLSKDSAVTLIQSMTPDNAKAIILSLTADELRPLCVGTRLITRQNMYYISQIIPFVELRSEILPFIENKDDLGVVLSKFPPASWPAFLDMLGDEFTGTIIRDGYQLYQLIQYLPEASHTTFVALHGPERIKKIIKNGGELADVMNTLPLPLRTTFLGMLGADFIRSVIVTDKRLLAVLCALPPSSCFGFIEMLGFEFTSGVIVSYRDFDLVLSTLPEKVRPAFITGLYSGVWRVKITDMIKNRVELVTVLMHLPKSYHAEFITLLGDACVKKITPDITDLYHLSMELSESARETYMTILGSDYLNTRIDVSGLRAFYINLLPERVALFLMSSLPDKSFRTLCADPKFVRDNIKTIIQVCPMASLADELSSSITADDHLKAAMWKLNEASFAELIIILGSQKLKNMMRRLEFDEFLSSLKESARNALVATLSVDHIMHLIGTADGMDRLLVYDAEVWRALIVKLGPENFGKICSDSSELSTTLSGLKDASMAALIETLGPEFFKAKIIDAHDLAALLSKFTSISSNVVFIRLLGADVIKHIIKDVFQLGDVLDQVSSKHELLTALGNNFINSIIKDSGQLAFVLKKLPEASMKKLDLTFAIKSCFKNNLRGFVHIPEEYHLIIIDALGDKFPALLDASKDRASLLALSKPISRSYKYYSGFQHQYESKFSADDLLGSIVRLFSEINGSNKYMNGYFLMYSDTMTQSIIDHCRGMERADTGALVKFLSKKLSDIDEHDDSASYFKTAPSHNGELAMRIKFCILKLNNILRPAPIVAQTQASLSSTFGHPLFELVGVQKRFTRAQVLSIT